MIRRSRTWLIFIGMFMCWTGCTVRGSQDKNFHKNLLVNPFSSYTESIPGSAVSFEMIAVPGGQFIMGSPQDEPGRKEDEGPAHPVEIAPFWMGKHEITWEEFELFVYPEMSKETTEQLASAKVDGVTQPTPPFVDMSFGMGKNGYPAINMTQYAALSYCKWLTALTGDFYRLPTEAEWEYACRAGAATAYSFGDDPSTMEEYAWYFENSDGAYQKVGTKKANPWGLHDMHGNVAEWTLDEYLPAYQAEEGEVKKDPWIKPSKLYPHVVRGGSWDDDPEDIRSAARRASSPNWKQRDPQIPKSNWWMTDASFLGFRIVRPLHQPSPEEIAAYFNEPIPDL
jgi:formylglycine-generating enzyme required for sulfatase activity